MGNPVSGVSSASANLPTQAGGTHPADQNRVSTPRPHDTVTISAQAKAASLANTKTTDQAQANSLASAQTNNKAQQLAVEGAQQQNQPKTTQK
jgi:hypothetical protein